MPDIDIEPRHPKTIEGKATRVLKYEPWFFWYIGLGATGWIVFALYAYEWDWRLLTFTLPGALLGMVFGIRFRNTP